MEALRFDSAAEYAQATTAFLLEHEVEHGLLFGLTSQLIDNPRPYGQEPYLVLVRDSHSVLISALMTPPLGLAISRSLEQEAIRLLASDVQRQFPAIPFVNGPRVSSLTFASAWAELSGGTFRRSLSLRIYCAEAVIPPAGVRGVVRRATDADRPLLIEWMEAFYTELHPDFGEHQTVPADVDQRLQGHACGWYLWEDGQPVSLVGYAGPTPHGIRIGPVYTPSLYRGHGYASAATAEVTRLLLATGRRFCFLYTYVSNATANKIYPAIGYELVTDVDVYGFDRIER
jgi:uncharacterized protein